MAKKNSPGCTCCGGGGGGPVDIPGCVCSAIPSTLYMTITETPAGACDGVFQPCTIVYGPTPPDLSTINLGANCYLSTQTFLDAFSGLYYRYNFGCDTIYFRLSRVYLPTSSSGAYHDASIYSWSDGQPGNNCTPFLQSNGIIYPGGNVGCQVAVGA